MIKLPLVSVIIPTKNEEKNITHCLASVQKQTYQGKIEVILVDNNSSDDTPRLATKLASKIVVGGPERSTQRNMGAQKASGAFLLFLDADMRLTPGVIQECVELNQKSMFPLVIAVNEKSKGSSFWGKALALERNCYQGPTWMTAARFFPKNYFLKVGGYDENLVAGEDWDLTERFQHEGFRMIVTKSVVYHLESNRPVWELLKKEWYYIKHIYLYEKKHPLAFSYQASLLYRIFVWGRSWHQLVKHPILTWAFLSYKLTAWLMWQWYTRTRVYS